MKTSKANNYDQAVKELKELSKKQANSISKTVRHEDRKHYHAICVRITMIEGSAKNKVTTNVVQLHEHGFKRLAKHYLSQGINKVILLHDPTQLDEKEVKHLPTHKKESIEAKIRRELKEKHEAEIKKAVSEGIDKAKEEEAKELSEKAEATSDETGDANGASKTKEELEDEYNFVISDGVKDDKISFADANGINLTGATNNGQRNDKIKVWWGKLEA